jgi:2-polyprenyl-6-methoxyphenol hydroxylase-like FAD-dependent oxidoreductase
VTIEVDVAIVGARIAGSVTAALLGTAGYRVLVVDTATFPSDTISTHFFRGAGLGAVLARLGLLDDVLALGSSPLTREYDFRGDDPTPVIEGPQDPGDVGSACLSGGGRWITCSSSGHGRHRASRSGRPRALARSFAMATASMA